MSVEENYVMSIVIVSEKNTMCYKGLHLMKK